MMENESKVSQPQQKEQRYKNIVFVGKRRYSGQFLNNKRDGKGREEDKTKNTLYEGYFEDDMYHGEGILYHELTKCYFKGIFEKNKKKAGIEIFPNGDVYEGEYKDDKFHGRGYLRNGDLFYFVDDGKASHSTKDYKKEQSTYSYEGGFLNGKKHGYGTETYIKGAVYVGEFRNNQRHGKGKLSYPNGSYYEGDFVNGLPCGFGIHSANTVEQISSIKPIKQSAFSNSKRIADRLMMTQSLVKGSLSSLQEIESSTTPQILKIRQEPQVEENQFFFDEQQQPEFFYEGEFMDGFKHGKGRLYFPDGSYYYCNWAFNKKVKDIIYYDALENKHCFFKYTNPDLVQNHFEQFNLLQQDQNIIKTEMKLGYPPNQKDGYKNQIDSCAINGDQFEDDQFKTWEGSLNFPDGGLKFLKLKENPNFYFENKDLFEFPIQPNSFVYNQLSDYQLIACLEALAQFPHIFFKIFTVRYDISDIGFLILKLYINGQWEEIIIDDIFPFYDSTKECIFTTTLLKDIGWLAIQKAFCKLQRSYFNHKHDQETKRVEDYFQMLSALPCKSIVWENELNSVDEDQKQNIKSLIDDHIKSCKIAYLQEKVCVQKDIDVPQNYPFIILDIVDLPPQQQQMQMGGSVNSNNGGKNPYENLFIIMKSVDPNYSRIKRKSMDKISNTRNSAALSEILAKYRTIPEDYIIHYNACKQSNAVQPHVSVSDFEDYKDKIKQSVFAIDFESFIDFFGSVYELVGVNQNFQSTTDIYEELSTQQPEIRYFFSFSLNLPAKILINVEQHISRISQHLPARIVLAQDKMGNLAQKTKDPNLHNDNFDVVARNKKDFLRRKFIKKVKVKKQMDPKKRDSPKKQEKDKSQSQEQSILDTQEKGQKKVEEEFEHRIYSKKKYYNLKYVFGKGQYKKKNIFKTINLDEGTYILMVQLEGPDLKLLQEKGDHSREFDLRLIVSIFGDNLLNIQQIAHPENFIRQVYEACIHQAEKRYDENKTKQLKDQIQDIRFQKSDLGDRENGSDQIIICQYYLQEEGTYLQLLDNRTDNKSWRQKLYFITENMKIFESNENKVDVFLSPHQDSLIIIQQVKGGVYRLEGGEGICLIENIQKNVDSDDNDDFDDN